jgi:hypothetical protein
MVRLMGREIRYVLLGSTITQYLLLCKLYSEHLVIAPNRIVKNYTLVCGFGLYFILLCSTVDVNVLQVPFVVSIVNECLYVT